jgi:hypothetical protein
MRVLCTVEEAELENDNGYPIDGVIVTCTRCEATAESFGTSEASIRRTSPPTTDYRGPDHKDQDRAYPLAGGRSASRSGASSFPLRERRQ